MEVLSFKSTNVEISAKTAADMATCWHRFRARVGNKADTYCDYRSTLSGSLELASYYDKIAPHPVGEPDSNEWINQVPVFYETATYNISIYFTNIDGAPRIRHKLKEVTDLFLCYQSRRP